MELPIYVKLLMHKCLQNQAHSEQNVLTKRNCLLNSEMSLSSICHEQYDASHNRNFFKIFLLVQFLMFHSIKHSRKDPAGIGICTSRLRVPPVKIQLVDRELIKLS